MQVTFTNEEGEYLYYLVSIKVTKCEQIETISLSTAVRTSITHEIILTNPTDSEVLYTLTGSAGPAGLTWDSGSVPVPPHGESRATVTYSPVSVGHATASLEAWCAELGFYPYSFQLEALPAPPEPPVHVTCHLGHVARVTVAVTNGSQLLTTFTCQVCIHTRLYEG